VSTVDAIAPADTTWRRDVPNPNASAEQAGQIAQSPVRRAAAGNGSAGRLIMNLGTSIVIKGDLSASEDLTLYGKMEGSVTLHGGHTLTIGRHADIRAAIDAKAVVIQGAVTGNVTAREKVEIQTTGSVAGDVSSPRLAIADGASISGKVHVNRE
jgi:cytoskeletal protein CcmA (bactofilin family)